MASKRDKRHSKKHREQPPKPVPTSVGPGDPVRRAYLIVTAFCSGASVMIVELAGNRILAPWFGNSLYTWTGLIGVILMSISAGYYLGGYLADKRPNYAVLAHLLAVAALLTILIPIFQGGVEEAIDDANLILGPVLATALLFAVPGCLLAAVSPFSVRLISLLSDDTRIGLSAGYIGMSSTLGSVAGTFGSGFVLIPQMNLRMIFLSTGLGLALLAIVGYLLFSLTVRRNKSLATGAIAIFAFLAVAVAFSTTPGSSDVLHDETTFYHRIRVTESPTANGDRLRTLLLDTTEEGAQYVDSRETPVGHEYQRYWQLAKLFTPDLKTAAFLGGGGFAMPEALSDAFPNARVDVVEIDPAVIEVGRKYFRVDEYPLMNAVADDARRFLRRTDTRYDMILGDAYSGVRCVPAHLVTKEFFELVKNRLTDRGIFVVDIPGCMEGEDSRMFRSVMKTISEVFAEHCVFSTSQDPAEWQNIFIVAASFDLNAQQVLAGNHDGELGMAVFRAGHRTQGDYDLAGGIVFTDDRNPVEYLVAQTLRSKKPGD